MRVPHGMFCISHQGLRPLWGLGSAHTSAGLHDPAQVTDPLQCCPIVPGLSRACCVSAQDVMACRAMLDV